MLIFKKIKQALTYEILYTDTWQCMMKCQMNGIEIQSEVEIQRGLLRAGTLQRAL